MELEPNIPRREGGEMPLRKSRRIRRRLGRRGRHSIVLEPRHISAISVGGLRRYKERGTDGGRKRVFEAVERNRRVGHDGGVELVLVRVRRKEKRR